MVVVSWDRDRLCILYLRSFVPQRHCTQCSLILEMSTEEGIVFIEYVSLLGAVWCILAYLWDEVPLVLTADRTVMT